MNTNLLNIMKRIIAEQGDGILADPPRLRAFFMDLAKDEPRQERQKKETLADLSRSGNVPY